MVADLIRKILANNWEERSKYIIILPDREKFKTQFPEEICYYLNTIEGKKKVVSQDRVSQELRNEIAKYIKKSEEKIVYLQKLSFMIECESCNRVSTHKIDDDGDFESYKLKCKYCSHIGYILSKKDFDDHYIKGKVSILDMIKKIK